MSASRVFVVQEPLKKVGSSVVSRIPLHTLEEFGTIIYLCSWGELRDDGTKDMTPERSATLFHKIRDKLMDFSDEDYIVPLGNPALIAMAVMCASECNHGRVSMLDWIRDANSYRIIDIDANCQPGALARARSRR